MFIVPLQLPTSSVTVKFGCCCSTAFPSLRQDGKRAAGAVVVGDLEGSVVPEARAEALGKVHEDSGARDVVGGELVLTKEARVHNGNVLVMPKAEAIRGDEISRLTLGSREEEASPIASPGKVPAVGAEVLLVENVPGVHGKGRQLADEFHVADKVPAGIHVDVGVLDVGLHVPHGIGSPRVHIVAALFLHRGHLGDLGRGIALTTRSRAHKKGRRHLEKPLLGWRTRVSIHSPTKLIHIHGAGLALGRHVRPVGELLRLLGDLSSDDDGARGQLRNSRNPKALQNIRGHRFEDAFHDGVFEKIKGRLIL
jgi:hypothetical protein